MARSGAGRGRSQQCIAVRSSAGRQAGKPASREPGAGSRKSSRRLNQTVSPSVSTGQMTVAGAVCGVVVRPRATFGQLRETPVWLGALIVSTVVSAASWGALYSTGTGRIALVDQWERTAFAIGQGVDDAGYGRLQRLSSRGVQYSLGRALVLGPVVAAAVAALMLGVSRRLAPKGSPPTLRQCLAVAVHAGVILALRDATAAPLAYLRETTASATTLGLWFPLLDEASTGARFVGSLDVFVLWWAALVGIGTATLCGRSAKRTAAAAVGTFAAGAGVVAVVIGLAGGGR
jgi:hypothetical protein